MRLRLEFPDRYRLWAELVKANTDRLFIETPTAQAQLDTRVTLELAVGGASLVTVAKVVGLRPEGGRFEAGVWVRLEDAEVTKVRRFLGLTLELAAAHPGRAARREPCTLDAAWRRPSLPNVARLRNLSHTGALLETDAPLVNGQFVELDVTLDDGAVVTVGAEVTRQPEVRYTGLRFVDLMPPVAASVRRQFERLTARPTKARQQLLVADDDLEIRELLARALSKHGYEVLVASSGPEAIALIRQTRPALVLLDILMPGMDGVDICRAMRGDIELARTPVIFASALDQASLHAVADESGATDYLTKPLSLGDLLNLVGRYLR